ncbi:MAG: hypothetical protein QM771_01185 [Nitrospira sp.]
MAKISGKLHHDDPVILRFQTPQDLRALVVAAVVDKNNLVIQPLLGECPGKAGMESLQILFFIKDRNNDRQHRRKKCGAMLPENGGDQRRWLTMVLGSGGQFHGRSQGPTELQRFLRILRRRQLTPAGEIPPSCGRDFMTDRPITRTRLR